MWNKVYKKNDDIVHRKIADETILVPIRGTLADMEKIFSLNPVAENIWSQIDEKRSLLDIRENILETFDVEKEQAESDITDFISQLIDAELIREVV